MKTYLCLTLLALVALSVATEEPKKTPAVKSKRSSIGYGSIGSISGLGLGIGHGSIGGYSSGIGLSSGSIGLGSNLIGLHSGSIGSLGYGYGAGYGYGGIHSGVVQDTHEVRHVTQKVPVSVPQPYPVTVTKSVPVPQPYPVEVPKPYPVAVHVRVPVYVPKPYHVKVPQPVPVRVNVPTPVEVPRPYQVIITKKVPVDVPRPVAIRVPHPVQVPVPQPVPVIVPTPVEVKVPHPVVVKQPVVRYTESLAGVTGHAGIGGISDLYGRRLYKRQIIDDTVNGYSKIWGVLGIPQSYEANLLNAASTGGISQIPSYAGIGIGGIPSYYSSIGGIPSTFG